MNYVMGLDIVMGYEIIKTAYDKKAEDQVWKLYLSDRPGMDQGNFMTFEQYKDKAFGTQVKVNKEEILKDAELIKQADMAGRRK